MKVTHKLIAESPRKLFLFILTNGEELLNNFNDVDANIIHCHIDSDGHDITQEELYNSKNVSHLMTEFAMVIKSYHAENNDVNAVVIGSENNAEVALDLLLKENELIEGGILIKPILNIAITDGIRIEDNTKVLIIGGDEEADSKQVEERDIADILDVNGYDVTLKELDEDEDLTPEDITVSVNWINDNF